MDLKKKWDWKDDECLRALGELLATGHNMREAQVLLCDTFEGVPPHPTLTTRIRQTSTTPDDFKRAVGEERYQTINRQLAVRSWKVSKTEKDDPLRLRPYKRPVCP